ncbi:hypothetical protein CIB48_g9043 [Xylaria polymorpha]|nr:hypothetical protein CIB48_g9043 [Xylaria polymorpha]
MADPLPTDGLSLIGLDSGGEPTVPGPWVFEMTVTLDHPRLRSRSTAGNEKPLSINAQTEYKKRKTEENRQPNSAIETMATHRCVTLNWIVRKEHHCQRIRSWLSQNDGARKHEQLQGGLTGWYNQGSSDDSVDFYRNGSSVRAVCVRLVETNLPEEHVQAESARRLWIGTQHDPGIVLLQTNLALKVAPALIREHSK